MEGPEAGLTTAVTQATELRRHIGAKDIVIHYGWDLFVNGEQVPRTVAAR